ncbi:hypothetical protein QJS10_CPA01g01626 [Acorus calamus]|uniref:Uncharacterized protein n=1 Tax=Acorus calamus TaxID=4465 RepID=A0AAV9FM53_ACOCL|nr:hypothetical protein QJS10_CPA01g01626 [Acorus calamus]
MASQVTENPTEGAEIHHGSSECKKHLIQILKENSLPTGLLPFGDDDVLELGYNRKVGYLWLNQKKKRKHFFPKIGKWIEYDQKVTAYLESHRMKRISGVSAKEFMLTLGAGEMYVDDPVEGKVHVKTNIGLSRVFPASAFQIDEEEEEEEEE